MAKSASVEFLQSPLGSVLNILPHGHEKALRHAFYNAAAFVFILVLFSAGIAVYFVLEAFIQPLLWAVLCGTVLFPFKHALTKLVQQWLTGLTHSGTPLFVGAVALPIHVLDSSSEGLANIFSKWLKPIIALAVGLPLSYLAYYFLDYVWSGIEGALSFVNDVLNCFSAIWVLTIFLGYILLVSFWWNEASRPILSALSVPVWGILLIFFATMAGPYRVTLFLLVLIVIGIGLSTYMKEKAMAINESNVSSCSLDDSAATSGDVSSSVEEPSEGVQPTALEQDTDVEATIDQDSTDGTPRPLGLHIPKRTVSAPEVTNNYNSDGACKTKKHKRNLSMQYIISLVWMCVLLELWMHMWWLQLLPLPVLVWFIKRLVTETGALDFFKQTIHQRWNTMRQWVRDREDALVPHYVRGLLSLFLQGDKKMISILSGSLDKIISIFIILSVFVTVILGVFLLSIQIQQESMYLVQVSGSLINETVSNHPELKTWLPGADDMHSAVDSMVDNLHHHGRKWISTKIHNTFQGHIEDVPFLEKQILEIWDEMYGQWASKNVTGPEESRRSEVVTSWNSVMNSFSKFDSLHLTGLMTYVQDNIETVRSIAESVWTVLKGNINIVFTILTTSISLVFGGGTALLNLVISFVIFMTTLFYLLSFSVDQYKPMQWISGLTPTGQDSNKKYSVAVEEAIRSVFGASMKMSAFYGLFTWFTHTLLNMRIVYIPAVLGMCLGAVPFLGTYWAAVPGMIELLVKDQKLLAVGLLIIHILPSSFVDTIIYADIKGGSHPYVTGLAVAGGIYCFGLKGAIIGPMLLCFLLVAFKIYSSVINSPPPVTPAVEQLGRTFRRGIHRSDTIT
ncbi:transmembrane protein 245-like [Antedon mediterranea]|uniref:transmembrane protein 245-like n=1 Tax=Antedon mediterranea TaxID=105859 RepID=UPI003AF8AAD9